MKFPFFDAPGERVADTLAGRSFTPARERTLFRADHGREQETPHRVTLFCTAPGFRKT
jgi:hypothetical protein